MKNRCGLVVGLLLLTQLSQAQAGSCSAVEADRNLPAAVKMRLLKGCQQNQASKACEAQAKEKKLSGQEKDQFVQKCSRKR